MSNPSVWLLLGGVILLPCIWGIFGRVDSTVNTAVYAEDGVAACYVAEEDIYSIKSGMPVKIDGYKASISEISDKDGQYYICLLELEQPVPDGFYSAAVLVI